VFREVMIVACHGVFSREATALNAVPQRKDFIIVGAVLHDQRKIGHCLKMSLDTKCCIFNQFSAERTILERHGGGASKFDSSFIRERDVYLTFPALMAAGGMA
jgi:hypothetical protein